MSKSKGNVVNPDDVVEKYGADIFRIYEMFIGPFDADAPWDTHGIEGVKRFLEKVWRIFTPVIPAQAGIQKHKHLDSPVKPENDNVETLLNQTIKKVGDDIETLDFNTAVSALMILANALSECKVQSAECAEIFLKLLAPFAPHIAEELWQKLGHETSIHVAEWPSYDSKKLVADTFELVVQVNGKVRDRLTVSSDISEKEATAAALASPKIRAALDGKKPKKVIYVKGRLVSIAI
ncbi:class I tRNA ligase family protein [Patescibacteria group bacterium]|nr:class I tRNA ligase family protein [Patescibacteria group bacterium]